MAFLFNETRGWQRVKTKYEQIKQAIEFESWYAQKNKMIFENVWGGVKLENNNYYCSSRRGYHSLGNIVGNL
jgi:hypothetical protein